MIIVISGHIYPGGLTDVRHIHEIDLDLPEECHYVLMAAMTDYGWGINPVFKKLLKYMKDFHDEISSNVYEYYKKALQCIFYKGRL